MHRKGSISFSAQQAWIINNTVRENILLGLTYDEEKYNRIVKVCALEADFNVLGAGDMTEIGERGINVNI